MSVFTHHTSVSPRSSIVLGIERIAEWPKFIPRPMYLVKCCLRTAVLHSWPGGWLSRHLCDRRPQMFVCLMYSLVFSKTQLAVVEFFTGIKSNISQASV